VAALQLWLAQRQAEFLGYTAELRNTCREVVYRLAARLHRLDAPLKSRRCVLKALLPGAHKEVDTFEELYPSYHAWRLCSPFWYHLLVGLFAIAELPFNAMAFRLFGDNDLLSTAVALGVAIAIPVIGHWIGVTLKRPSRTNTDVGLAWLSILVVTGAVLGIGRIRAIYLEEAQYTADPAIELYFYAFQFTFFAASIFMAYLTSDLYLELKERVASIQHGIEKTGVKRDSLREKLRQMARDEINYFDGIKAAYDTINANNGGPLSKVQELPALLFELPTDFDSNDDECPVPIEQKLAAEQDPDSKVENETMTEAEESTDEV